MIWLMDTHSLPGQLPHFDGAISRDGAVVVRTPVLVCVEGWGLPVMCKMSR